MTPGLVAMLAGLFVIPGVLLWAGHKLRRRPPRWRGAFWGALLAHVAVAPPAMLAGMIPPAAWAPDDRWRGFIGLWALLVAPLVGAVIGALRSGRGSGAEGGARQRS